MATGSGQITVTIHGLDELRGKLVGSKADPPVNRFLDRGGIYMQGQARKNAAVDTGRMRNSIGVESPTLRMRRIGPNAPYAEHVEFGTVPHMPPEGALAGWARRHGMKEYDIRHAISIHGTKAQPFMQPAADDTSTFMETLVPVLAAEIESAYA